jgi:hypothetical protein
MQLPIDFPILKLERRLCDPKGGPGANDFVFRIKCVQASFLIVEESLDVRYRSPTNPTPRAIFRRATEQIFPE